MNSPEAHPLPEVEQTAEDLAPRRLQSPVLLPERRSCYHGASLLTERFCDCESASSCQYNGDRSRDCRWRKCRCCRHDARSSCRSAFGILRTTIGAVADGILNLLWSITSGGLLGAQAGTLIEEKCDRFIPLPQVSSAVQGVNPTGTLITSVPVDCMFFFLIHSVASVLRFSSYAI